MMTTLDSLQEVLQPLHQLPIRCFGFETKNEQIWYPMHWHRDIEMLYCVEDGLEVQVLQQVYHLQKGDLLFINSQEIHYTKGTIGNKIIVFQMTSSFFNRLNDDVFLRIDRDLLLKNSHISQIPQQLIEIYQLIEAKSQGYLLKVYSIIYNICYELVCHYRLENHDYKPLSKKHLNLMSDICDYIKNHLDQELSLTSLAQHFSYTPQYISSLFKKHLNISFLDYVNGLRVDQAIPLLLYSELSLTEIAKTCGFASPRAFNQIFYRHYHLLPHAYRQQNLKK